MPRSLRIAFIAVAIPTALLLWVSAVFAMDRASNDGEVLGRVTVAGVDLGGLDEEAASAAIDGVEARLASDPITVFIQDSTFTVLPSELSYDVDTATILDEALARGRDGGFMTEMGWWLSHFGDGSRDISFEPTYDRQALILILKSWEPQAINDPPTDGGINVTGTQVTAIYPEPGTGLDYEATADLIEAQVLSQDRGTVNGVTEFRVPIVTGELVDLTVERAQELVARPVTLGRILPETSITFPVSVLAEALSSRQVGTALEPKIELFFQLGPLARYLNPIREEVETDPIDAQVVIRPDDIPLVLPGYNALLIDDGQLPDAVYRAATSVTRTAPLPIREGREADFSTEDAEALGIRDLLYSAETYYSCCGDEKNLNRIINIKRIAAEVDGAIILPGETFSLNDHVGKRTLEDGYRRAGAIIGPVVYCCDHPANIGGGVSQFATTLWNAVYWSGLEDVFHKPHTLSFSRYPVVREATLGFPSPDVKFTNSSNNAIYIKTEATDTRITVVMFGDLEGAEVEGAISSKFNFTDPEEYLKPNDELNPGDKELTDEGAQGFTATDTRTITFADGTQHVDVWTWTYVPHSIIFEVHPCELPEDHIQYDASIECPVQVPSLGTLFQPAATTALNNVGLVIAIGEPFIVSDSAQVGTVRAQSTPPGTWVDRGTTVTVRLGLLPPP
ncbi:MAG: VanW family protein [Acidimicrobiia bacterium]